MRQSAFRSPVLQKARQWRMSSYSWTAPPLRLECSVRPAQGCGASAMAVAASLRPGAWRSRSSGPTARYRGFCATLARGPTRVARSPLAGRRGGGR
jgi:hypothetical protein